MLTSRPPARGILTMLRYQVRPRVQDCGNWLDNILAIADS